MPAAIEERTRQKPDVPRDAARQGLAVTPRHPRASWQLLVEMYHVPILGLLAATTAAFTFRHTSIFALDPKAEFVVKVVDVAAVFVAYALSALAVIPALNDRSAILNLRSSGLFKILCGYVASALFSSGWLILMGLALKLCFDHLITHQRLSLALSSIWWGSVTFALFALIRASRTLLKLVISR